uniref:Reverse transcriptase domain-containing protein n=1 Tax=Tanacetum cinerariifolium TaxID=118510 RepID=A0A699HBJ8_TANCI|nr:reverse transcriptase domain-containing protein [Tanacetum cinerariifolium]
MPTPPPSPLTSLSPPSAGERLARCTAPPAHSPPPALIDAIDAALPSPPLPPLPPPVDRRDDILETEMPPRKRSCLFALGSRYEIGESSTDRPEVDPAKAVPKIAPMTLGEVNTRVTELAELHEHDTQDLYALLKDAQDSICTRVSAPGTSNVATAAGQIMAPMTRQGPNIPLNNTNPNNMTPESVQAMIDQALLRNSTNGDESHSSYEDNRRNVQTARPCFYTDFIGCANENQVKFATCTMLDADLTWWNGEIKKLEIELWNLKVKGNDVPTYTARFQELTLICTKFVTNETEKIDKYISGLPDNIYGSVKSSKPNTLDETIEAIPKGNGCFECGSPGHFKRDCPKLKNKDGGNVNAQGWVYAVGNAEKKRNASRDSDSNVVMGTFLLNNRYASILFDTGADRSFISTAFSSLIDIVPTSLGNSYDVELADGKIVGVDTIIRGCTLNFLNHMFNIDLMPIELGSFDVIIGMDWLRRCHAVIMCDEKLVRVPYGNETLIFCSDESNDGKESRLTIISCSKAQEYMAKGCQIFLAQISAKNEEDKSEGKQLKDVPIV